MIALLSLSDIGNGIMTPFYWLISSVMIFFHWVFSPLFGAGPDSTGVLGNHSGVSWLLAIVMMTCVIRGIMLPLYAKQLNSQRAMTALQPKLKALQEKYKADRQRLGAETMKLYQDNGVSPYASCLPMIVQMPVLFSVFWVIRPAAVGYMDVFETIPKVGSPVIQTVWNGASVPKGMFFGHPELVASFQTSHIFGSSLSQTFLPMADSSMGTKVLAVILMVGMVATLFYQQWYMMKRNMPPTMLEGPMGQQQKMMLYVFPFIYLFTGLAVPIGVMFYWLISNVWTMMQQYFMVRIYPTPDTPAYAAWEDRMIAMGKDPVAIERERIEKARSKRKGGGLMAKMTETAQKQTGVITSTQEGSGQSAQRTVQHKAVTRTDPDTGKQVVVRQQPHKKSRAKRKH